MNKKMKNKLTQAVICGKHLQKHYPGCKVAATGRYARTELSMWDGYGKYSGCTVFTFEFFVHTPYGNDFVMVRNPASCKLGIPCADPWEEEEC